MFVDEAKIFIASGKGGNGAVSFRREPFVPEGGPDGGDGGDGGNVIIMADGSLRTLMDFRYQKKYVAQNGENGMRKKQYGKKGEDLVIKVPPGTVVTDEESGLIMKDLVKAGDSFVAAKGGRGGRGNVHYKSSVRQAPSFAEAGGFAKERNIILELKLIADVGLVGFPNVGKSSLLAVCTKAKPKIANYHFTTTSPNLGVVESSGNAFVMADIAGIIEGASEGAGMGFLFLKHVERTKVLIHVVDVSGSEDRNPIEDFEKINAELLNYSERLSNKPQIVAANKIDLIDEKDEAYIKFKEYVEAKGLEVYPISAPINQGVKKLINASERLLKIAEEESQEEIIETFDFEKDDIDPNYRRIYCARKADVYTLEGRQLSKIFNSTNFNDIGSIRYLYKYIERSGALEELKEMGLKEGDIIRIEDFELEYIDEF